MVSTGRAQYNNNINIMKDSIIKDQSRIFCNGEECPVRRTCLRYTKRDERNDGKEYVLIRKCTLQRRYLQDANKVNADGKEHRK